MIETLGGLFPPDDGPVVLDGAMGSELRARGWSVDELTIHANVARPELVETIHAEHLAAGAQVILTNTFAATLGHAGEPRSVLGEQAVGDALVRGVEIARRAAETHGERTTRATRIAGSLTAWDAAQSVEWLTRMITLLVNQRVDVLVLETVNTFADVDAALRAVDAAGVGLPVVISCTTTDGSPDDHRRLHDIARLVASQAELTLGLNCGGGPSDLLRLATALPTMPAWLKPNTGRGHAEEGDTLAAFARAAIESGARFVGGCCGTTPRILQTMAAAMMR